jgi:hypothetical protein
MDKENMSVIEPEISFSGEVPIPPNVRPIIIVKGSDYEMGYQYYQQIVQIFGQWVATHQRIGNPPRGPWLLKEIKNREFSRDELALIKKQETYIKQYAPETLSMFDGMAQGATDYGISLSYMDILAHFLGYPEPPFKAVTKLEEPEGCSGFAAWGNTTVDGKLICGANGDDQVNHFSATIIAFPDKGNNFVYSPFHVVAFGGFPCHPGMNNKGLVYVHHGGGSVAMENRGRGLPRGIAILHTLRFANSTNEALEMQLAYPRSGKAGGLWADIVGEALCIESAEPEYIRRPGYLEETDFIFATNNCICKESGKEGDAHILHAGYLGNNVESFSSIPRNLEMWNMLHFYRGKINLDFVRMMYRFSGNPPDYPTIEQASNAYIQKKGDGWDQQICNKLNSVVCIVQPYDRVYHVCQGCAARIAYPHTAFPDGVNYVVNPTHSFYQLELADKPLDVVISARERAQYNLYYADIELGKLGDKTDNHFELNNLYNQATTTYLEGEYYFSPAVSGGTTGNETVYKYAKALRAFTRTQALAQQVLDFMSPPPTSPEELGLKPFRYWEKSKKK